MSPHTSWLKRWWIWILTQDREERWSNLETVEEPRLWFPPCRTGGVSVDVVLRQLEVVVTAHTLLAHRQGSEGLAVFHLPVTQSGPTWHRNTPAATGWGQWQGQKECKHTELWFTNIFILTQATWLMFVPVGEGERTRGTVVKKPAVLSCLPVIHEADPVIQATVGSCLTQQTVDKRLLEPADVTKRTGEETETLCCHKRNLLHKSP